MIAGTPVHVDRDENVISVLVSLGDSSTSLEVECGSAEEAAQCFEMWSTLISVAIDDPANSDDY